MVRLTLIARLVDGLPLAEGLDSDKDHDLDEYKRQAKALFKKLSQAGSHPEPRMSVEAGAFVYHYLIEQGVVYLTLAERGYPKKLAYQYLEELQSEFSRLYGPQVDNVSRPYAFIKFDTFIQKTKKLYMDTRTQRNIAKLSEEVTEVHSIMTRNIQDVLAQGEKLDRLSDFANQLTAETKKYAIRSKDLYRQAIIRKYLPFAVVGGIVLVVIWIRSYFY